jgi:hypothetical protein
MIPKKKYRDKVRQRLELIKNLFGDRPRVEDMMKRVKMLEPKTDIKTKLDAFYTFIFTDVHVLLDALDKVAENARQQPEQKDVNEEVSTKDSGTEAIGEDSLPTE